MQERTRLKLEADSSVHCVCRSGQGWGWRLTPQNILYDEAEVEDWHLMLCDEAEVRCRHISIYCIQERTRLRLEADTEDHRQARLDLQLAKVLRITVTHTKCLPILFPIGPFGVTLAAFQFPLAAFQKLFIDLRICFTICLRYRLRSHSWFLIVGLAFQILQEISAPVLTRWNRHDYIHGFAC